MSNKRVKKQIRMARQKGIPLTDLAKLRESAKKYADAMEDEATEKAFLYMLAIPLNILVHDYWSKSAKRRAPKFIKDVLSLYDSVENGVVTDEELADLLHEYAGLNVNEEWLKKIKKEK